MPRLALLALLALLMQPASLASVECLSTSEALAPERLRPLLAPSFAR
jgi:hypothetical protein